MTELERAFERQLGQIEGKCQAIVRTIWDSAEGNQPWPPRPATFAQQILALIRAFNKYAHLRGSSIRIDASSYNLRTGVGHMNSDAFARMEARERGRP